MGKEFSHVLGVTATNASEERQRGKAPMGSTERSGERQGLGRRPESWLGNLKYEFQSDYFGGGSWDTDEIRDP